MDAIEATKRQAYADGLAGTSVPRAIWLADDEWSRAYREAWLAGAIAASAPDPQSVSLAQGSVRATFAG